MLKIAIDDGHGIDTKGKQTPDEYKENEFNHFTKELLKEELKRNGFEIIDCSPNRLDNSLSNRVEIANNNKADVFISIHFNAYNGKWGNHGGIETYVYQWGYKSEKIARLIHKYLCQGTVMKNRGVKTANFYVLRNTKMPAILVECGFMDNKKESELMKSTKYQKECSFEICKGLCEYYEKKYISSSKKESGFEVSTECKHILMKISKYDKIWIDFFEKNKNLNLSGLIENAYFHDDYKEKYDNLKSKIDEFIKKFDKS